MCKLFFNLKPHNLKPTMPDPASIADLPALSELQLRRNNGERGRPVWVAYNGLVYDVSASSLWRGGMHQNLHYAGLDHSTSISKAPHGDWVFARFPIVGRFVE
ncbi:MAG: hypothetical protein M5U01_23085 [Ardenticatenaceae bacterium]|nr:hypothetical protein [Ardenticatenaceae bacterium]